MSFLKLCTSDPLLDFLRSTYDAIPLRVPDSRIRPLLLFTTIGGKMRPLGNLADLATSQTPPIVMPQPQESDLAAVKNTRSARHSWKIMADFLHPFLTELLQLAALDVDASIQTAAQSAEQTSLSLGGTRRSFVHPIACAHLLDSGSFRLPAALGPDLGSTGSAPLYLIDGILRARQFSFSLEQDQHNEAALKLHSDLLGKVAPERLLKAGNALTIIGAKPLTFAFTCLQVSAQANGMLTTCTPASFRLITAAAPVAPIASADHAHIGTSTELFSFDE
jgi:hypothetical protein